MLKISDIATHVGVSSTTVSYVLNNGEGAWRISEKTRQKVLQAAEDLGYRSNSLAKAMRTGDTKMLGVLGGITTSEPVGRMLEGALSTADLHGNTLKLLRLHAIGNSAQQAIRRSSEWRLTGLLALHLPEPIIEDLFTEAQKYGTPLVLIDTYCQNPRIPQVVSDDEQGFALGVEHLVKLGHSKIALIKGGGDTTIGIHRKRAFELALARHGLTLCDEFCQEGSFHQRHHSLEAARQLLSQPVQDRPTAIFCANDFMAMATLKVAREMNIDVPSQLSVIGFSNMAITEHTHPTLTTIDQSFVEMGQVAIEMLMNLTQARATALPEGNALNGSQPLCASDNQIKKLPTRLIERESTAPAPR